MTGAVLAAECVAKRFGARRVLASASLRAVPGQLRALAGRNGAGKSTLLKIAAGWMAPDGGAVHVRGVAIEHATLAELARAGVFYLPDHDLLSSAFTVRAQLELLRRRFDGGDPEEAAAVMGIAAHLDRRPSRLSGGELRRAEVAAALVRRPACLLADEPYRGIAPVDAEALTAAFRRLAVQGCAVVVTGHEVRTVLAAADHVTWVTDGTSYELGPPEAAAQHPRFREQYLGPTFGGAAVG